MTGGITFEWDGWRFCHHEAYTSCALRSRRSPRFISFVLCGIMYCFAIVAVVRSRTANRFSDDWAFRDEGRRGAPAKPVVRDVGSLMWRALSILERGIGLKRPH